MNLSPFPTVSLCIPYYDDPHRLRFLLMQEELSWFNEIIIVDDGSRDFPAKPIVEDILQDSHFIPNRRVKLFTILEDFGFNAHGARNLAAAQSKCEWLCFLDVDMQPNEPFLVELSDRVKDTPPGNFILCNLFGDDPGNIFCVRREDFERAGGYDEELRGYHMGDKLFRERLDSFCTPKLMHMLLPCNRVGRVIEIDDTITGTLYPDDSTVVQRRQVHIEEELKMIEQRNQEPDTWRDIPKLQFEWREEKLS